MPRIDGHLALRDRRGRGSSWALSLKSGAVREGGTDGVQETRVGQDGNEEQEEDKEAAAGRARGDIGAGHIMQRLHFERPVMSERRHGSLCWFKFDTELSYADRASDTQ